MESVKGNPIFETRNPKQIQNSKSETMRGMPMLHVNVFCFDFLILDFEFRICFGFRILDFEF